MASSPIREVVLREFESLIAFGESLLADGTRFPNRVRSAELMLRTRNLVRRACGEGSEHCRALPEIARLEQPGAYVPRLQGVLLAAVDDFREGRLLDLRRLIEADVLGALLDQAEALLAAGHLVAAASLTGAILEDALKKVSDVDRIAHPPKPTIDSLNAELAKAGTYSTGVQENIAVLAAIRSKADQGHATALDRNDVEQMVSWVRAFVVEHLRRTSDS
jgi:hypothetical protein